MTDFVLFGVEQRSLASPQTQTSLHILKFSLVKHIWIHFYRYFKPASLFKMLGRVLKKAVLFKNEFLSTLLINCLDIKHSI